MTKVSRWSGWGDIDAACIPLLPKGSTSESRHHEMLASLQDNDAPRHRPRIPPPAQLGLLIEAMDWRRTTRAAANAGGYVPPTGRAPRGRRTRRRLCEEERDCRTALRLPHPNLSSLDRIGTGSLIRACYRRECGGLRRISQKQVPNPARPMTTTRTATHIDHVMIGPLSRAPGLDELNRFRDVSFPFIAVVRLGPRKRKSASLRGSRYPGFEDGDTLRVSDPLASVLIPP